MSAKLTIQRKPFVARDKSCPPVLEHPDPTELARACRTAGAAGSEDRRPSDNFKRKQEL
jgi:hypothetical protein